VTGIHAFMTNAMKADLRACGFSEEQLAQLTPQEGDEILAAASIVVPDSHEVREFVATIVAQARAATKHLNKDGGDPGILQMILVHPLSNDMETIYRYALDDPELIERMTSDAINASESGHNVYIEARTTRRGLNGKERGKLTDTVAVYALVVDSDADKGKAWTPTVSVSLTVSTSPGNHHYWLFFETALDPATAQKLGERLRKATGGDADTGVITQPFRVSGTTNYRSKKKQERGRTATAPTRTLEFNPETLWTTESFEREFPATSKDGGGNGHDAEPNESGIPAEVMHAIRSTEKGGRGQVLWNVVRTLKEDGCTAAGIVALLAKYPDGLAAKFRGRLHREVERVYNKIKGEEPGPQPIGETFGAEGLKIMTFAPVKYVVPSIFVEGLTLFAGKPKTGKSWLLLHAAIAVARGGFTLGEIHCIEGDVLYCALEDSKRRLQARMTKLMGISQEWPKRLSFRCEMPRLSAGGLDVIREWITSHPKARLVVIDTLAMVRSPKKQDESTYDSDYAAVLELRKLANETGIAIVVVHHLRKADSDDAFDTISGTLGLTGAPDTIMVLKRDAAGTVTLHAKGRDLIEIEKAMVFDRDNCIWRVAGDAVPVRRSAERASVLGAIKEASEPVGPNDIAGDIGMRSVNVRKLLGKLVKEGVIENVGYGKYQMRETAQSVTSGNAK
jgi:AAA domain/RepB DNA-primase from phage plasmid